METHLKKLDALVGTTVMLNAANVRITGYLQRESSLQIRFAKRPPVSMELDKLGAWLDGILPVDEDHEDAADPILSQAVVHFSAGRSEESKNIRDILLDNIKRVKEDKDYIPQAQSVVSSVNALMDVSRTELALLKTMKELRR